MRSGGQGNTHINMILKEFWRLRVPGKIKHFVWKVLWGTPCYGTLAGRHIPCSAQCLICLVGCEDLQHGLFTCRRPKDVWFELGLSEIIQQAVMEYLSGSITMEILARLDSFLGELPTAVLVVIAA